MELKPFINLETNLGYAAKLKEEKENIKIINNINVKQIKNK